MVPGAGLLVMVMLPVSYTRSPYRSGYSTPSCSANVCAMSSDISAAPALLGWNGSLIFISPRSPRTPNQTRSGVARRGWFTRCG
jgi:hypothetical protein